MANCFIFFAQPELMNKELKKKQNKTNAIPKRISLYSIKKINVSMLQNFIKRTKKKLEIIVSETKFIQIIIFNIEHLVFVIQ